MWVTKLLISPVKKRVFCPKTTKFGPKLAFLVNLGQAMQAYSMPCCGSVGGCGARAISVHASMATISVNLRSDKISPLVITIVSGLTLYLKSSLRLPQPIVGLSYINILMIASSLVLFLHFVGTIWSSKLRWGTQCLPEDEAKSLEEKADRIE